MAFSNLMGNLTPAVIEEADSFATESIPVQENKAEQDVGVIPKTKVFELFKQADEQGVNKQEILDGLVDRGYVVEGYNPTQEKLEEEATTELEQGPVETVLPEEQDALNEREEGLKGFFSETGEALGRRKEIVSGVFSRNAEDVEQALEDEGPLGGVKKFLGDTIFFPITSTAKFLRGEDVSQTQLGGQIIAGGLDIAWEGVENAIQEFTPEVVETAIEDTMGKIGNSRVVQAIAESYSNFKEENPETARNIEGVLNVAQILPIQATGKAVTKPFTKTAQEATRKAAERKLINQGRGFLNFTTATDPAKQTSLTKFFADRVKPTQIMDEVAEQFDDIGKKAIQQVDNSLASSTTKHRPASMKEVLKEMVEGADELQWNSAAKKELKDLLKKVNTPISKGGGLTLTEINAVKRKINQYTKGWTLSGKEGAGLKSSSVRNKYREVQKFLENQATKENLGDIGRLNKDWIQSDELSDLLWKQATAIGKKQGVESITAPNVIEAAAEKAIDISTMPLRKIMGRKRTLADSNIEKAIERIKKTALESEKVGLIERGQILGKKGLDEAGKGLGLSKEKAKEFVGKKLDEAVDKIGARSKFIDDDRAVALMTREDRIQAQTLLDDIIKAEEKSTKEALDVAIKKINDMDNVKLRQLAFGERKATKMSTEQIKNFIGDKLDDVARQTGGRVDFIGDLAEDLGKGLYSVGDDLFDRFFAVMGMPGKGTAGPRAVTPVPTRTAPKLMVPTTQKAQEAQLSTIKTQLAKAAQVQERAAGIQTGQRPSTMEAIKAVGRDTLDNLADKTGARTKLMQDTGRSLDDFSKVGTTKSASIENLARQSNSVDEFVLKYFQDKSPIFTPDKMGINRVNLQDIIKSPDLYKKYPELKNADIVLSGIGKQSSFVKGTAKNKPRINIGKSGWEDVFDEAKRIKIQKKMDDLVNLGKPDELIEADYLKLERQLDNLKPIGKRLNENGLRALNHELEHAKQELKGFKFASQDNIEFDDYFNLPEEVKARAAETKFLKTREQLEKIYNVLR